ncbi:6-phosphogluconolactonase [Desulfovibrionales bacterium]
MQEGVPADFGPSLSTCSVFQGHGEQVLTGAGEFLCARLARIVRDQGQAVLGVPGGRSVARVFQVLAAHDLDWQRVHVFLLDERCVPVGDPESNYGLVQEHLITPLHERGTRPGSVHPFAYNAASADQGAQQYTTELAAYGLRFDVLLASMGEDGHVASLFPRHAALGVAERCFVHVHDAPKPPPARISASLPLLRTAQVVALVVLGQAKAAAFAALGDPLVAVTDCPAKALLDTQECVVFTDC